MLSSRRVLQKWWFGVGGGGPDISGGTECMKTPLDGLSIAMKCPGVTHSIHFLAALPPVTMWIAVNHGKYKRCSSSS